MGVAGVVGMKYKLQLFHGSGRRAGIEPAWISQTCCLPHQHPKRQLDGHNQNVAGIITIRFFSPL